MPRDAKTTITLVMYYISALVVGFGSWYASYWAGMLALEVSAAQSSASWVSSIEIAVSLNFRVPEQYLEQGYRTAMAMDINLSSLQETKRIMPYVNAFVSTMLQDSPLTRCCTGIFVNYDWTYLERHGDSYNHPNAFALANVMLHSGPHYWEPAGRASAKYETRGFQIDNMLRADNTTNYSIGFINWTSIFQREDAARGFHFAKELIDNGKGSPEKAWWSPIYRYDIMEPYALKAECGIPLHYPYNSNNTIGMWVLGFQVTWISYLLKDIALELPAGAFIFLVEQDSHKFVSSADPDITGLQEDASMGEGIWPFTADRCKHRKISSPASKILQRFGSFAQVARNAEKTNKPEHFKTDVGDVQSYIYVKHFSHREIKWLMIVTVPEASIMKDIRDARAVTLPCSFVLATASFLSSFFFDRLLKKWKERSSFIRESNALSVSPDEERPAAAPTLVRVREAWAPKDKC